MKYYFYFLIVIFLIFSCKDEKKITLEKGISLKLAQYRKQQVNNVLYELSFNIPLEKTTQILAKLKLKLSINTLKNDLFLDFNESTTKLKYIIVNGNKTAIKHKKEHIIINKNTLKKGNNKIEISFIAGELSLNRNKDFLYTLLVPDRASTLFPCFDQPDIKANYKLNITTPKGWKVLCGAFEERKINKGNFIEHIFRKTDKMSTYLFSFVAGDFYEKNKNLGAFNVRFLYREDNKGKILESVDKIFNIHQKSINFLENYTTVKFPFQKMDFVAIPHFQYGGMEHIGATQYRESLLFLDQNATQIKKLNRAKLIAHETSHMWFGNFVSIRWFNDVWMKEVFANFMADKIMNPIFKKINHNLNFMMSHYPKAYSEDRTKGANAIRQSLKNLKNAGSLYGNIIYHKAPIMMRQLEEILGKEKFKEGIQEYIKNYANDNADWNDLVTILDKKTSKNIKKWSKVWVNSSGRPIFSDEIKFDKQGKITSFIINQKASNSSNKIWEQTFNISLIYKNKIKKIKATISDKQLKLTQAIGLEKPNQIIYNSNGFGYGVFPIDNEKIHKYKELIDEVSRGYQYINLYENMLNGKVSPLHTYQTFLEALKSEKNELILKFIANKINTIFWTFLVEEKRNYEASNLVKITLLELSKPKNKNQKTIIYNLLKNISYNREGVKILYNIWSKKINFKNLFLNENNYISLAMKLAIFKHKKASEILKQQQKLITNSDKLKRFKWLLPSLSNDNNIRDNFMKSLLLEKNREKELWVQMALNNIHHPLRQKTSIKHLRSCLKELEEIQLTGDIFFPKGWLISSVGNYSSKESFRIVNGFLKENPNFNPVLKGKLLQATDNLFRAQIIK